MEAVRKAKNTLILGSFLVSFLVFSAGGGVFSAALDDDQDPSTTNIAQHVAKLLPDYGIGIAALLGNAVRVRIVRQWFSDGGKFAYVQPYVRHVACNEHSRGPPGCLVS